MKKLEDLEFNLTKDMSYTLINALKVKEQLNGKITEEERLELEKEFNTLKNTFIRQFKHNNKKEIDLYNQIKKKKNRLVKAYLKKN